MGRSVGGALASKHRIWWAAAFAALTLPSSVQADEPNFPTIGEVVRIDPKLDSLIPAGAKIDVLASGFEWSEGPVWVPEQGGFLLWSDIPRNLVMKWKEGEGARPFLTPSGYTGIVPYGSEPGSNGLARDAEGRLLFCEHGDRRVSRIEKNGGKRTLADGYQGKRLNSPNDLVLKSNGDIFFTDPPYGLPLRAEDPRREMDYCGVYRLTPDGKLSLLTKEITRPNGIALSPDEKTLYVANSDPLKAVWYAYDLKPDGTIANGRVFASAQDLVGKHKGLPDGMKVDQAGNLFATGPGGVHVYTPKGKLLGRIDTKEATANCAFGDDGTTLYLAADMYLCRIKTATKGLGFK
jgi:gluconolactonase